MDTTMTHYNAVIENTDERAALWKSVTGANEMPVTSPIAWYHGGHQADMDNAFWPYYQARAPFGFVSWFGRCVWAAQRKADGIAVLCEN
jgi:hypothetical protein